MTSGIIKHAERTSALMQTALACAVPLWIMKLKSYDADYRIERARVCGQIVAEKGDVLQFGSKKKGETAAAFNALAEGLACLAFYPGGVKFLDLHFEIKDP